MAGSDRPPPLPYLRAVDVTTEPGLGLLAIKADLEASRKEAFRLRRERNEWRDKANQALTASAPGTSLPPEKTPARKAVGVGVGVTQWIGVATMVLTVVAQIASMYKPGSEGPIEKIIDFLKGIQ